jgi:hypothetical protein
MFVCFYTLVFPLIEVLQVFLILERSGAVDILLHNTFELAFNHFIGEKHGEQALRIEVCRADESSVPHLGPVCIHILSCLYVTAWAMGTCTVSLLPTMCAGSKLTGQEHTTYKHEIM